MRTLAWVSLRNWLTFFGTSITEMVPSGSLVKSSAGSPSLATITWEPFGVKARESGSAPPRTPPR